MYLVAILILGAPAALPPARIVKPQARCELINTARNRERASVRKLGELPPADAYQAVYRVGPDGCLDPLLVSERLRYGRQKPSE